MSFPSLSAMLLAAMAFEDAVKAIVAILFLVLPLVWGLLGKLAEKGKEQGKPQPGRQRPMQHPAQRAQAGGQPPRPAGGPVDAEVEDFLRRAAQRQQGQRQQAQPAAAVPLPEQPVVAEVARTESLREKLKHRAAQHLDTEEFDRRTSELGGRVSSADREVEQRLHTKFDHSVSSLSDDDKTEMSRARRARGRQQSAAAISIEQFTTTNLAAMLRSPEGIRQAIILNEILTRPEHRWE